MSDVVHVVNGHSTSELLAEAELPGDIAVWADCLDQGPLRPGPDPEFRAARADFLAGLTRGDRDRILAELTGWDAAVDAAAAEAEEVVLWYEHDLFDQLALVRLLARLASRPRRGTLSMVSIDHHAELPDFKGLGELEPPQLAGLWPRRTPIGQEALDEAAAAWIALTAPDPRGVHYLARRVKALPFLGPALGRWLEDLPAIGTGLSRTEAELLRAVARGAGTVAAVMSEVHTSDRVYLLTDQVVTETGRMLVDLGALSAPIGAGAAVTTLGDELVRGRKDRVALGMKTWRGGVRLEGSGAMWRWDPGTRRPVIA